MRRYCLIDVRGRRVIAHQAYIHFIIWCCWTWSVHQCRCLQVIVSTLCSQSASSTQTCFYLGFHFYSSFISSCLENCVPANPFKGFILMYCWLFCMNLLWTLGGSLSVYSPFTTIFCSIWLSGIAEKMIRKNEQPENPKQLFAFRSFRTCLSICHALHHFSICF